MVNEAARLEDGGHGSNYNRQSCYRLEQVEKRVAIVETDVIEIGKAVAEARLERVTSLAAMEVRLGTIAGDVSDTKSIIEFGKRALLWGLGLSTALLTAILTILLREYVFGIP